MRAGSWSFATSRLTSAQYQLLLALMLAPAAVVEARATYGRADGQGTFVTVWGRRCCVCHVYSYFDSRGTQDQQPGWTLYFTLAAEEMGREAGTAGSFVMPEPGSYAYVPPAAVAGPVVATKPDDGSIFLPLTKAAFDIYSQQLKPAIRTLEAILGSYGSIQGRAKNPESAANRIQRAVQNGWAKKMENVDDVLQNLWDAVGTRVVLHDSSPSTIGKLVDNLIQSVHNGELSINAINNLYGAPEGVPYLKPNDIQKLEAEAGIEVVNKPYDSGYTVVTVFVEYKNGVKGEIQLIGQETLELANAEHLVYDAFLNKPYLPAYRKQHHAEVVEKIEPIRNAAQGLDVTQQEVYKSYLSEEYRNARYRECLLPVKPTPLPSKIPRELAVDNLLTANKKVSKFKLKS